MHLIDRASAYRVMRMILQLETPRRVEPFINSVAPASGVGDRRDGVGDPFEQAAVAEIPLFDPCARRRDPGQKMGPQGRTELAAMAWNAVGAQSLAAAREFLQRTDFELDSALARLANPRDKPSVRRGMVRPVHHQDRRVRGKRALAPDDRLDAGEEAFDG